MTLRLYFNKMSAGQDLPKWAIHREDDNQVFFVNRIACVNVSCETENGVQITNLRADYVLKYKEVDLTVLNDVAYIVKLRGS